MKDIKLLFTFSASKVLISYTVDARFTGAQFNVPLDLTGPIHSPVFYETSQFSMRLVNSLQLLA